MIKNNPFSGSGKRFYAYSSFLKQRYGGRIAKIPLDGGFTCPNRDGTKGVGGCIYCSSYGSGDFVASPALSIAHQYEQYIKTLSQKWSPVGYIPYFQAFTGTYAPIERLRELYTQAVSLPNAVGLSVATRPDCLDNGVCDILAEFAEKTDLTVELGVQTVWDETALLCNMCHGWSDTLSAVERLKQLPVQICVHLINGLPNETHEQMVESARLVGQLGIHAVKLHSLHVLRGTALAEMDYTCMSREAYIAVVCDQLECLSTNIVIQRLTGDGKGADLIAPDWSRRKREVLNGIDMELKRRDSWQGKYI